MTERWVVKIGSSLLTNDGTGLALDAMADWVAQMAQLRKQGIELVVVSSGSIAEGCGRLGWSERPSELHKLQAAAAVGQMGLVQSWESEFQRFDAQTALVLLVGDDVRDRARYLNARNTLNTLLKLDVVPVINENDTIATEEICFGDNDSLAALVANLVYADRLVILTDQQGLFSADPRQDASAELIAHGDAGDASLLELAGGGAGRLGRGGMRTKLLAARQAAKSGTDTFIVNGREPQVLLKVASSGEVGTHLHAENKPAAARKQWISGQFRTQGQLDLDAGATTVIVDGGRSLLPVGVVNSSGDFAAGDVVSCVDPSGVEVARGLVNYSSEDVTRLQGLSSAEIAELDRRPRAKELIHRDNLVVL